MNKQLLAFLQEDSNFKLFTAKEQAELLSLFSSLGEVGNYTVNRDSDGVVQSVSQDMGNSVTKTTTVNRVEGKVNSISILYSDNSFTRMYTFIRDANDVITGIQIS